MNEEYNRSILIGSSENVVERDESSLSIGHTAIKSRLYAHVKNTSRTVLYGEKAVKINAIRYNGHIFSYSLFKSR